MFLPFWRKTGLDDLWSFDSHELKTIYFFFRSECLAKGGTNSGSCANGFGVCCICKSLQIPKKISTDRLNLALNPSHGLSSLRFL